MNLRCNVCGLLVYVAEVNDGILHELTNHVTAHYNVPAKFEVLPDDRDYDEQMDAAKEVALLEELFKLEDNRNEE
jgi:hypothetical protein